MSGLSLVILWALAAPMQEVVPVQVLSSAETDQRTIFADFIGLSARIIVECDVTSFGLPEDCVVAEATPAGAGFERVALSSAASLKLSPQLEDGKPVAAKVSIPLTFRSRDPFPPYEGAEPDAETVNALLPFARRIVASGVPVSVVADVAQDRRAVVQGWIDELLPPDPDGDALRIARRFGRVLTPIQVQEVAAGRRPSGSLPDWETLNSADHSDPRLQSAAHELRRRYCAEYDCRDPFAEDRPGSPRGASDAD